MIRAAVVLAAATLASSASAATPKLLGCSGTHLLRPAGTVVLACADANAEFRGTHWSAWGAKTATGRTDFGLNLCNPYCAASTMSWFPHSRVVLEAPRRTKHGLLFTRVVVTYTLHGHLKRFVGYPAT